MLARVATDKVQAVAALDSIEGVDLDEVIPLEDPRPEGAMNPTPQPPPSAATPRTNPYMPIQDTNADDFTAANPTWDGRGVTIGIVDTGIDLDHPSLNVTSTGEAKIVDWVTGTLPSEGDPTWLDMSTQVTVSGGSFTVGATTYSGAADGSYRFASFNEASLGAGSEYGISCGADLNRNGTCNQVFGVLWRAADNKVFVDDNADGSFAGEPAMTDFKVNRDKGYFGTDNPATAIKEAVPFVVQTDGKNKFVNIGIVAGAHGSHVAGIASGNALFGGAMSGQAPGAKIVSLRACLFVAGCTAAALTDGMVYVAKQSNVDVINMSIGGLPSLNDGNNARCVLYTRLIEQSNVQMFISAGNSGSGLNTVGDPSVCGKVMSVGSYISKDSWQKNYGSDSAWVDNLHGFSSRGPREDGGFAPQIVAPGSAISTVPTWQVGQPVGGTYVLPPGYGMFNGTSMAAPQATGSAALLLSAAKQLGIQKQPDQLREAFMSSSSPARREPHRHARAGCRDHRRPGGLEPVEDESADRCDHLVRAREHDSLGLPRHPGHRPGDLRPRRRDRRPELHADIHLHPHFGWRRCRELQPVVGGQRRHVQYHGRVDLAGEEHAGVARRLDQSDDVGDPLGGAAPRRSQQARDRVPDLERGCRRGPVHRCRELLGDEDRHDRPEPDAELLLPCARRTRQR